MVTDEEDGRKNDKMTRAEWISLLIVLGILVSMLITMLISPDAWHFFNQQ